MGEPDDPITELFRLVAEAGLTPKFGLRAQGHIQLIAQMLLDGDDWPAIGKAIRWTPTAARQAWERLCEVAEERQPPALGEHEHGCPCDACEMRRTRHG